MQRVCRNDQTSREMGNRPTLPSARTTAVLGPLFEQLDYATLAEVYCDTGGTAFWDAHKQPAEDLGCRWAAALGARLPSGGTSLYVGAGVAELPALVTEILDLDRRVVISNLDPVECQSLNASLAAFGGADLAGRLRFQCQDAAEQVVGDATLTYDHLSVVSVLSDPGTFPVVSAVAYGRVPPVLLDVDEFEVERGRIRRLVGILLGRLGPPALITTTVEEVAWFLDGAKQLGLTVAADDQALPTAIVGDPLGFLRVT